jgi:hypothetical protein
MNNSSAIGRVMFLKALILIVTVLLLARWIAWLLLQTNWGPESVLLAQAIIDLVASCVVSYFAARRLLETSINKWWALVVILPSAIHLFFISAVLLSAKFLLDLLGYVYHWSLLICYVLAFVVVAISLSMPNREVRSKSTSEL